MPSLIPREYISALYEAAFNRAPDNAGLTFWEAQFAVNPATAAASIAAGFTSHPAFTTLYGGLANQAFVQAIYVNALGSAGDIEGIAYWTSQLNNGLSRADFLASFVSTALSVEINSTTYPNLTPDELATAVLRQQFLINKADVGLFFADTLGADSNLDPQTDPNSLDSLLQDPAYLASLAVLAGVTDDPDSVADAQALIDTANTQPDPAAYINDNTLTLTTHVDRFTIITPGVDNTVHGIVDGDEDFDTSGSTYTNGDIVNGNGQTIVELTVVEGGNAANGALNNVANVNIIAGAIPAAPSLNDPLPIDSVTFNAVPWSDIGAVNLVGGTNNDLNVNALSVSNLSVLIEGLEDDTDLSIASGVAGSLSADYISGLIVSLAAGNDSTLSWADSNVDATVAGSETATFTAFMQAGDITVGDINATVGPNGYFGAFVSSSASGDLSVGNVTVAVEDGGSASVSVDNIASGGSITVGDVSMLGGAFEFLGVFNHEATGDVLIGDVSMSVSGSGALALTVSNTGASGESLGSLTIGAIDLVLDDSATGSVAILNSNDFTKDELSLGALTVGDMTIDLGSNASMSVSITQSANVATGVNLASFGDATIGNLTATLGDSADMRYGLDVAGINAAIGSVTVGDVAATVGAGGVFSYAATVTGDLGVGDVTFGNFDLTANNAAAFQVALSVSATNGDVGSVTVGDISFAATGDIIGKPVFFDVSVTGSGEVGVLDIGNISFDTTEDVFHLLMNIVSDGDIDIAILSFNGTDVLRYDGAFLSIDTVGDVSLGSLDINLSISDIADTLPGMDLTNLLGDLFDTYDNIDYSGLKLSWAPGNPDADNGVSIDLTTYKGNTSVIGSDYNDIITDNAYEGDPTTGINKLTGGGGADTFVFSTDNTGKTLTTLDQVLDFSNSDGDKLNVGVLPTTDTYGEASFADFASFLAGADAADKGVYIGSAADQNSLFVASDFNSDGNVDFLVQLVGITDLNQIDIASFV
ncbi:MAG: DUF4214 domain-containing protein [Methylococcales bacterium]|nr:DUF4214 domain-containing protein [Methylococcales bacterium]